MVKADFIDHVAKYFHQADVDGRFEEYLNEAEQVFNTLWPKSSDQGQWVASLTVMSPFTRLTRLSV